MSTLKVDAIRHNSATSDAITTAADGTCTAKLTSVGGGQLSHRNIAINGAMTVAQRGSSGNIGAFIVDRFPVFGTGHDEIPTQAQVDVAAGTTPYSLGFRKALKVTNGNQTGGAGASDRLFTQTKLEAQDIANSGWNYTDPNSFITLSYWVKSSVAQNFYGDIRTFDGTAQGYCFETGSLTADTWTKIVKKIPGNSNLQFDNDNDSGITIVFGIYHGTDYTDSGRNLNQWAAYSGSSRMPDNTTTWYTTNDATFEYTGVQLEVGNTATSFEHRSFGDELMRCMRYYETNNYTTFAKNTDGSITSYWSTITSNDSSTLVVSTGIVYKVGKRASPTVTLYNPSNTTTANRVNAQGTERTVTATYGGPNALTRIYVSGASSGNYVTYNWEASAEL